MTARHFIPPALLIVGLAGFFTLLLTPTSLERSEFLRLATDACHGPLLGLTAIGLLAYLRSKPDATAHRYLLALLLAVALGAAGELAQWLLTTTRQAQFKDLVSDVCGAVAGLCLYARHDRQLPPDMSYRRLLLPIALAASAIILAPLVWSSASYLKRWTQAPALISWESRFGHHFLRAGNADSMVAPVPPAWRKSPDEQALYVWPRQSGRWTGVTIEEPLPDWRAYDQLAIEVINPNDAPLELLLRIDDRDHNQAFNDRFNRTLVVDPQRRAVLRVPLSEIKQAPATRQLSLDEIAKLVLFQDNQHHAQAYYLLGMRLVQPAAQPDT